MILGSGLGTYADDLSEATAIPYPEIIGMPRSLVAGHAGNLVLGRRAAVPVVAMQGRVHLYEGHDPHDVVFGLRLMAELGAQTLIVTNAAGSVNAELVPGDLMGIEDHLLALADVEDAVGVEPRLHVDLGPVEATGSGRGRRQEQQQRGKK